MRFSSFLQLLRSSQDFRSYFVDQLASTPFEAYRWETPAVTSSNVEREFECVLLDCPELARKPDATSFAPYFQTHAVNDVAVFPNLGNDAIMIVPCPITDESCYGHLAAFNRVAPEPQKQSLWQAVGETVLKQLGAKPIWLNTAGAGVSWLHVRLDSRPKYYAYAKYKSLPS